MRGNFVLPFRSLGVLCYLCDLLFKTFPQLCGPQIDASDTRGARREKVLSLFQEIFSHPAGKEFVFPPGKPFPPARSWLCVRDAAEHPTDPEREDQTRSIFHFPPF
jgi:hypothetical protein